MSSQIIDHSKAFCPLEEAIPVMNGLKEYFSAEERIGKLRNLDDELRQNRWGKSQNCYNLAVNTPEKKRVGFRSCEEEDFSYPGYMSALFNGQVKIFSPKSKWKKYKEERSGIRRDGEFKEYVDHLREGAQSDGLQCLGLNPSFELMAKGYPVVMFARNVWDEFLTWDFHWAVLCRKGDRVYWGEKQRGHEEGNGLSLFETTEEFVEKQKEYGRNYDCFAGVFIRREKLVLDR